MKKILLFFFFMSSFVCYAQDNNGRENDVNQIKQAKAKLTLKQKQKKGQDFIPTPQGASSSTDDLLDSKLRHNYVNHYLYGQSIGFTYNYGKHYPYGASLNYSYNLMMLSLDFGINNDGEKYYENITDEVNYTKKTKYLDPKYFLTVTPSYYMKYFSVGCGIGFLYLSGEVNEDSTGTFISYSIGTSIHDFKFMIRPNVKGFIPITDELSLSLSAGYDYVFKFKEKNGFNFGLGIQWFFDY